MNHSSYVPVHPMGVHCRTADYDDRAHDSPIWLQRYWQRQRFRHVTDLIEGEGLLALIVIIGLVPAPFGLYLGWRAIDAVATASVGSNTPVSRRLTPMDLRNAPVATHALDAAPPAGGYAAVDAVSALPWAHAIARGWAADARLDRIDVAPHAVDAGAASACSSSCNAGACVRGAVAQRFRLVASRRRGGDRRPGEGDRT